MAFLFPCRYFYQSVSRVYIGAVGRVSSGEYNVRFQLGILYLDTFINTYAILNSYIMLYNH